ncbi:hypothetical protein BLOT_011261 [Blomia tropicalis]|nr:hypothetical protein BLOT_011261 [Blomia tropicalis]
MLLLISFCKVRSKQSINSYIANNNINSDTYNTNNPQLEFEVLSFTMVQYSFYHIGWKVFFRYIAHWNLINETANFLSFYYYYLLCIVSNVNIQLDYFVFLFKLDIGHGFVNMFRHAFFSSLKL